MGADAGYLQNKIRELNEEVEIITLKLNEVKKILQEIEKMKSETEYLLLKQRKPLEDLLIKITKGLEANNKFVLEERASWQKERGFVVRSIQKDFNKGVDIMKKSIVLELNEKLSAFLEGSKILREANNKKVFKCLNELASFQGKKEDYFHPLLFIDRSRKGKIKKIKEKFPNVFTGTISDEELLK